MKHGLLRDFQYFLVGSLFCGLFLSGAAFGQAPVVASVVNSGDFSTRLSPGCDASIFGSNFTAGATVTVGGLSAYVISNNGSQINVELPFSLPTGGATVTVNQPTGSASGAVNVVGYAPAFSGNPAVFNSSFQAITGANPANPSQTLSAFFMGLGATSPPAPLGPVGNATIYNTATTPVLTLTPWSGGAASTAVVSFSGLQPGSSTGLYQVNFTLPGVLSPGLYTLTASIGGFVSNTYQIPVASSISTPVNITNSSNLGVYTIGTAVIPLNATGGNGLYSWTVTSGSLPPGMSIRTDVPGYSAAIAGIATTPGNYSFTLQVSSGGNQNSLATQVRITNLDAKDNYQLPDAFSGAPYSYTFNPEGNTGAVVFNTASATGIPAGMSLSAGGVLSTNAGANVAAGGYNINLSFTDQATGDTCYRGYHLNVYNVGISTAGVLPNATQNASYNGANASVAAFGGDGNYTYTALNPPNGLTVNATTGAITGTANYSGKWNFSITVSDGAFGSYTKNFAIDSLPITVNEPNINVYGTLNDCTFGNPCLQGFGVNGGKAPYTWNVTGLPTGMGFSTGANLPPNWVSAGDMALWGAPLAAGTFNITVTVTDASNSSTSQVYSLHVSNLNLWGGVPNGTLGSQYNGTGSGYPFVVLGGSGSYTAALTGGPLPEGLTLNGLALSGTPLENGSFSAQIVFTDTTTPTANTLAVGGPYINGPGGSNLQVNNTNLGSYLPNQNINYQLSACCVVGAFTWSPVGALPSGINLSNGGLVTGSESASGTYSFMVQVTSSNNPAVYGQRLISFTISPMVIQAPNNNTNLPFGNVSTTVLYSQTLGVSGNTGAVTWSLPAGNYLPPGLSLNASSGTISGLPSQAGQYYFTVVATDSAAPTHNTAQINLSIAIYPAGQLPPVSFNSGPNLGTQSIGEIQDQLFASGGNGAYTWAFVSGQLPPGLSLRTDFPAWFSPTASAGLIGVATTPGTYTFTLSLASAGQTPIQQTFTLKIVAFDMKDTFSMPDAFAGQPYSYQLTALNIPQGATATFGQCGNTPINTPPGLTLSPSGLISGTIGANVSGSYTIEFSYSDGTDTLCRQITVNVFLIAISTNGPAAGVLPNATQNSAYSATVTATGGTGTYNWTTSGLPSGLSISTAAGASATISGTPTNFGKFNFTLTATDGNRVSYTEDVSIDTIGVPVQLPRIIQYGNFDGCTYGWPCSRGAGVYSGGTAPFTWNVTGLPAGMTFRQGSGVTADYYYPGDVEIWGSPIQSGSFPVVFTVTDANGAATSQTFTLNVTNLTIDNGLPNGTYGVGYSSTMRVVGGTPPYKATAGFGVLPNGLSFPLAPATSPSGVTVSGTPMENGSFNQEFFISDSGTQTIQYTAYFNIAGAAGTTITVNTTTLGPFTTGTVLNTNLSACCVPSYTWSFPGASPSFLTLSAGGALTGTLSQAGVYQFFVKAQDATNASNYGIRLITLTVTPLSINPTSLPYGNVGVAYSQTLSVTGTTDAITWSVAGGGSLQPLPPGFTLTGSGATTATLQGPNGGPTEPGQYFFTITALDASTGSSTTRGYTLNIYPNGQVPPLSLGIGPNLGIFSVGNFIQDQLIPTGGNPLYTYSYTPGATPIPGLRVQTGGQFPTGFASTTTGGLLGLVATPGTYNSSIRVMDNSGSTFDRAVTLTVSPMTILSTNTMPKATVNVPYSFQFTGFGGSGNYSWSATGLPAGTLAFSTETPGLLTGTATASGTFSPQITIKDLNNSTSLPFGFSLTVNPFAINNNAVLAQGVVGVTYSPTALTVSNGNCGSNCAWSVFSGSLPGGLSLNGSTGVISGTPTGLSNGSFTIQATGSAGTVQKLFSLQVVAATPEPLLINTNTLLGNTTVGGQVNTQLTVQGGTPPYSWTVTQGSLPPGISLNGPGETLGANDGPGFTFLWGRAQQAGTYNFTLTATDSSPAPLSTSQAFTWQIQLLGFSYTSLPISGNPLTYNQPYSQALLALGGSGSYIFSAAAMPPGLSLSSAGVVSGTPTNTGSITDTISVADTSTPANTGSINVTFNIASPTGTAVTINAGPNLGTFPQGNTNGEMVNLNPTGGTGPYTITALTPLPPGCAIETLPSNTELTTATANYVLACESLMSGVFQFTLEAMDSSTPPNIGIKTMTLTVQPIILDNSTALQAGSVGVPYSATLITFDNSGSNATWSVAPGSQMPDGLSINGTVISGTPTKAGNYTFSLRATDASGNLQTNTYTLSVSNLAIINPPTSTGAGQVLPIQATLNQFFTFTFAASGGSPLTWSATGLPGGVGLASTTGVLSGTPTGSGLFRVTVTVTSGASTYSRTYGLYVSAGLALLNLPESATNLPDAVAGQAYGPSLNPTGGTPPYSWSVAPGSSLPAGLVLASGVNLPVGYTPGVTIIVGEPVAAGQYTFTLICTDATGAQMQRIFSLNVSAADILGGGLKTATENVAYNEQLTGAGGTPPYTFTYSALGINTPLFPTGVMGTASGLITGTPTSTGNYSFYATVTDSAHPAHSYTTSYTLSVVNGPNNLEITTAIPFDLTAGKSYNNFSDLESVSGGVSGANYTYSVAGGALPLGLSLNTSLFSPGQTGIVGAPNMAGPYNYTVHVTDGAGNTADRTYTGVVMPVNQSLFTMNLPTGTVGKPYNAGNGYQLAFISNTNAAGFTFVESPLYPLPTGMTLSSTGLLSGTPQVSGNFLVYFSLKDNATGLTSNTGGYTLNVTPQGTPLPLTVSSGGGALIPIGEAEAFNLDQLVVTGTPPYTWTVAQGSSLPPGASLLPGSGSISSYVTVSPAVAVNGVANLVVTDATGQSASFSATLQAVPIGITPLQPSDGPNGVVGTPYSQTFTLSGGTPPYKTTLTASSDLPAGLTFTASGNSIQLSGTPTYPGSFKISFNVTDSASPANSNGFSLSVTIDAAAGGAPGLSIAPASLALNFFTGASTAPYTTQVNVVSTSGNVPFTAAVLGIPGATLTSSGTAPATLTLTMPYPTVAASYTGVIAIQWQGSGFGYAAVPVTVSAVNPPPCTYSANPGSGSINADGSGAAPFGIVTGSLCAWTVSDPDPWVTITSAASGTGPADITFTAAANPNPAPRTSNISINNGAAVYSITQFGSACSFTISPSNITQIQAAGASVPVSVTASGQSCTWSASGLGANPTSGVGNGTVTVTIPQNLTGNTVNYSASIAPNTNGQLNFTASQVGVNCVASFLLGSAEAGAAGTAGVSTFNVSTPAGCSYATSNVPSWITVTSGATGSGPANAFNYSVAPNPATVVRSATITIGGEPFTVNQDALACSVTLDTSPLALPFAAIGGGGSINVIANGANCSWAASSGVSWATVSPPSGTGSGSVNVTAVSNASSAAARTGSITVAGTNVNVSQAGTNCSGQYSLSSVTGSVPASGGNGTVGVMAPAACTWIATSQAQWLTIQSSGTSGNSFVQFSVASNTSATPQTGTLTIAGLTYTVTQAGAPCSYVLPNANTTVASAGIGNASFTFSTAAGCTNTALSYSGWITGVTTTYDPSGTSGTVNYTAAPNPAGTNRVGTLQIGDQTYTVTESGAACAFGLNSYGASFSKAGGNGQVLGAPNAQGCTPVVGTTQTTIVNLGMLSGPVMNEFTLPYMVNPFQSAVTATRRASITFGGLTYVVKQTSW